MTTEEYKKDLQLMYDLGVSHGKILGKKEAELKRMKKEIRLLKENHE